MVNGGKRATLRLDHLPMPDTFVFANNVSVAGDISVDVTWDATGPPTRRGFGTDVPADDFGAFLGEFAEASCTGTANGNETGFSFDSGPLTADAFFAEMGPQRNGVFLDGTPPGEALLYGTNADRTAGNPLDGAVVSGKIFVWLTPLRPADVDNIRSVDFFIDGKFRHREVLAPYDMISGNQATALAPWDTGEVLNGVHTLRAMINTSAGNRKVEARIRVAN